MLVIGLLAALDVVGVGDQGEHAQLSGGALLEVVVGAATAEDKGPAFLLARFIALLAIGDAVRVRENALRSVLSTDEPADGSA